MAMAVAAMNATVGSGYLHAEHGNGHRRSPVSFRPRIVAPRTGGMVQPRAGEPLKVMISGAPASGKGTQCELIRDKYGLVHIAAGDLLRAEVDAGTANGKKALECMNQGKLVPNAIVVSMVKQRLEAEDAQRKGWLLDGYPRSLSQAEALEALNIRPHLFLLLEVPDEILIGRVVGRRLDPVTGKIYHLTFEPPETPEIAARLTQRSDDILERVKLRLETHRQNVKDVLSVYSDLVIPVDGNRPKDEVFSDIDLILQDQLQLIGITA